MLSVIIPVYNVEKYIYECIKSVVEQSIKEIEIIVVDDGSQDNSIKIVEKFIDKRIKILKKDNGGLSSARNEGLKVATGEYVIFVDSDDYLKDNTVLEEMYRIAKESKSDIVVGNYVKKYDEKEEINKVDKTIYHFHTISGIEFLEESLYKKCYSATVWKNLFKTQFLIDNKLWFKEGIYHEDELFTPITFSKAKRVSIYPKEIYVYRQRQGSIMNSAIMDKRISDTFIICTNLLKYFSDFDGKIKFCIYQYIAEMILSYSYKNRLKSIPKYIKRELLKVNYDIRFRFRIILLNINHDLYYLFEKFREK